MSSTKLSAWLNRTWTRIFRPRPAEIIRTIDHGRPGGDMTCEAGFKVLEREPDGTIKKLELVEVSTREPARPREKLNWNRPPWHYDEERRIRAIKALAARHGYYEVPAIDPTLLIFRREATKEQVNVWWTRMTVATSLDHPNQGKTQLYRRGVDWRMLDQIFQRPRTHTGRGYYHT